MRFVIGLGSNLGDRLATLREAITRISETMPVLARSSVWETTPVDAPSGVEQQNFYNAAIVVEHGGAPLDLLDRLNAIERDLGRTREIRNGPRTIDLDVLLLLNENAVIDHPRLVVPHPRLTERAFALAPLLEVVPTAIDPRTSTPFVLPLLDGNVRRLALTL